MRNSRHDGVLVVKIKNGYKMAIDGHEVTRYRVKCLDIDYESEYTAADLEQYLTISMMSQVTTGAPDTQSIESKEQENKMKKFYESENPSVEEVEEQAKTFEMMVQFNNAIQMSKIMQVFEGLIRLKRICLEDGTPMAYSIWKDISRSDKNTIIFSYIAFFVNPLQKLSQQYTPTAVEKEVMQGQPKKT